MILLHSSRKNTHWKNSNSLIEFCQQQKLSNNTFLSGHFKVSTTITALSLTEKYRLQICQRKESTTNMEVNLLLCPSNNLSNSLTKVSGRPTSATLIGYFHGLNFSVSKVCCSESSSSTWSLCWIIVATSTKDCLLRLLSDLVRTSI